MVIRCRYEENSGSFNTGDIANLYASVGWGSVDDYDGNLVKEAFSRSAYYAFAIDSDNIIIGLDCRSSGKTWIL